MKQDKAIIGFIIIFVLIGLIGFTIGVMFEKIKIDKIKIIKESCSEIDEICGKDFIRMCQLSCNRILCDRIFEAKCEDMNCYCNGG